MYTQKIEGDTAVFSNGSGSYSLARILSPGIMPTQAILHMGYSTLIDTSDLDNTPVQYQSISDEEIADLHYITPTQKLIELYMLRNLITDGEVFENANARYQGDMLIGLKALDVEMIKYSGTSTIAYDGVVRTNTIGDPVYFTYSGTSTDGTLTVISDQEIYGFYIKPKGYEYTLTVIDKFSFSLSGPNLRQFVIGENSLGVFLFILDTGI